MKYKRLPELELKKLEKEFVQFLASNTITADDWQKIKQKEPNKANELIDLFSDIVYQKVMEKIDYLEFRSNSDINCFKCEKETIFMMMLQVDPSLGLDLRKPNELKKLGEFGSELDGKIKVIQGKKDYKPNREEEVFNMMNNGAQKSSATMFLLLENLYKKMKEE